VIAAATTDRARIEVTDLSGLERGGPRDEAADAVLLVIGEVVRLHGGGASAVPPGATAGALGRM
jgi:hypothetical protein